MRSLLLILISLCAALPAAAQSASSAGVVEVRLLAERVDPQLGQVVLAVGAGRTKPFALPSNHLSEPQRAVVRQLDLLRADAPADPPPVPLVHIILPDEGKRFCVILVPDKAAAYQAICIRTDDPAFRAGDVFFYNHSPLPITGKLGTTDLLLPPATHRIVRPAGARAEKFYDVAFGVRNGDAMRVLSSTRWPVENRSRSYVFFFEDPVMHRVDYRAVDEYIPPEPAPDQR